MDVSENETITCAQKFLKTNMYHKVIKQIIIPGYDNTYKYTSYKVNCTYVSLEEFYIVVNFRLWQELKTQKLQLMPDFSSK